MAAKLEIKILTLLLPCCVVFFKMLTLVEELAYLRDTKMSEPCSLKDIIEMDTNVSWFSIEGQISITQETPPEHR